MQQSRPPLARCRLQAKAALANEGLRAAAARPRRSSDAWVWEAPPTAPRPFPRPHSGRLQKEETQAANLRDAPGVIPADKQPPKEVSAMAEVHIRDLHCVKRQDPVGKDRAYLQINGRTIAGPFSMGTGDHVWVNVKEGFTGEEVLVTLMEEDAGPDDNLGTARIDAGLVGDGIQKATFNAKTNADYHMTYDVHG